MPTSPSPNFDPADIARQLLDIDAELRREMNASRYEQAAALRDRREALERLLNESGNSTLIQNVKTARTLGFPSAPVIHLLEAEGSAAHPNLLRLLEAAPLPVRWLIQDIQVQCRATLAQRLNVSSLESPYFRAPLPVFSAATLARATYPQEWLTAVIRESMRALSAVVWIVADLPYLNERGILDGIVDHLREPSTQFVACARTNDAEFASRFANLPAVSVITASG